MPELKSQPRTSLEIGFSEAGLPDELAKFRGKVSREVPAGMRDLPFEDAQFEVVLMDGRAVNRHSVREAHRVLVPNGVLRFVVPERSAKQEGMSLPDVYSVVRDGFNIVEVSRPPWWFFGLGGRKLTICARKKSWKSLNNTYRPYV